MPKPPVTSTLVSLERSLIERLIGLLKRTGLYVGDEWELERDLRWTAEELEDILNKEDNHGNS